MTNRSAAVISRGVATAPVPTALTSAATTPTAPGTVAVARECDPGVVEALGHAGYPWMPEVPRLRLARVRTVVVVAAHLDEELCAAGGLLASLAAGSAQVIVLALTEGDGAAGPSVERPGAAARLRRRRAKLAEAYQLLGLGEASRHRMGLGCGQVGAAEADVLATVSGQLERSDAAGLLCLAPWTGDAHPDHAAAGRAAALACQMSDTRLLQYSIAGPGRPDGSDPPLPRAHRFLLPTMLATRKFQALAHLTRSRHSVLPGPSYAVSPAGQACEVFAA